jgi:hypothetical protein
MRPVTQDRFYKPPFSRGNCVASCIASIFEVPLVSVDIPDGPSATRISQWTNENYPLLRYVEIDKCTNFRIVETDADGDLWRYDFPEEEPEPPFLNGLMYWMAFCISPRVVNSQGPYRGMPGQHAVVMKGRELVWDPHPQREMGVGRRVGYAMWMIDDPSRL